jgi:hypothetical protein
MKLVHLVGFITKKSPLKIWLTRFQQLQVTFPLIFLCFNQQHMYAHCMYICDECIKKVGYKSEAIMEFQEFCVVYLKWNST